MAGRKLQFHDRKVFTSAASLIQQEFSWGRFLISQAAFQAILASVQVFVPFLDAVRAFGLRVQESNNIHAFYRAHISQRPDSVRGRYYYGGLDISFSIASSEKLRHFVAEICYVLHYMAKNGRNRGDPWSMRQTAIYQQMCLESGRSSWILLHPSKDTRAQLEQELINFKETNDSEQNHMHLHNTFLLSTAHNWEDYLEDLHQQLADLVSVKIQTKPSNTIF